MLSKLPKIIQLGIDRTKIQTDFLTPKTYSLHCSQQIKFRRAQVS